MYHKPISKNWTGRQSNQKLYLHEKVTFFDLENEDIPTNQKSIILLGYACDEGVQRNQGRVGAKNAPDMIRVQLGKMPNHLESKKRLIDAGNVSCTDEGMEEAQAILAEKVAQILENNAFPILLGGGHDIAYGHYNGIKQFVGKKTIGIINFDAHFDLRNNTNGNNSGTPFYQIAKDCESRGTDFKYMALGIRKDANDTALFNTAEQLKVDYIENNEFTIIHWQTIKAKLSAFIKKADYIYITIDLDGFSSAYAPGVSAASPMGFSPTIVLKCLEMIINSKKVISLDLAEMNPAYDRDNQTAKLAATLVHFVIHNILTQPYTKTASSS